MRILPLNAAGASLEAAGGKGANLARLARAGFPVPPGFIIATDAYRSFVVRNGLHAVVEEASRGLHPADSAALDQASAVIQHAFLTSAWEPASASAIRRAYADLGAGRVAVRSSATAEDLPGLSFAGQQDTYLNVRGGDDLLRAVVRCWASLWSARAMGYRLRNALTPSDLALAVIVQQMIESDTSGVLFTANPLTGLRTESVMDATFGLGEALVSGQVEPDHYVVDSLSRRITLRRLGSKQVRTTSSPQGGTQILERAGGDDQALSDAQIEQVVALGQRVQHEFGTPQDIEWAFEGGNLYVLQARPITSLYPLPRESQDPLLVWFSFGAVQGLLGPMTPLGMDSIRLVFAGAGRLFGLHLQYDRLELLAAAGERLWVRLDGLIRNPLGVRLYPNVLPLVEPSVGRILATLSTDPHLHAGQGRLRVMTFLRLVRFALSLLPATLKTVHAPERAVAEAYSSLEYFTSQAAFPAVDDPYRRLQEFVAFLRDRSVVRAFELIMPRFLPLMAPGMASLGLLTRLSGQAASDHGVAPRVLEITRGLPDNVTTQMDLALWHVARIIRSDAASLARFKTASGANLAQDYLAQRLPPDAQVAIAGFMDRYGMRGVGEIDLGMPRWREQPEPIMQTLQSYLRIRDEEHAPDMLFERGARAAQDAVEALAAQVRKQPDGWLREKLVRGAARRVRALLGIREAPKYYAIRVMGIARGELLAIGQALAAQGVIERSDDLAYLFLAELDALSRGEVRDWKSIIAIHRAAFEREARRRQVPRVLVSDGRTFYEGLGSNADSGGVLRGSPVSPGLVQGVVHVVLDPHSASLSPGEILVCPGTDPAWTPLFMTAVGLITEVGGMMTHGSVVAREYGIPAVVGVDRATLRLKDGQRITLDGTSGTITMITK